MANTRTRSTWHVCIKCNKVYATLRGATHHVVIKHDGDADVRQFEVSYTGKLDVSDVTDRHEADPSTWEVKEEET